MIETKVVRMMYVSDIALDGTISFFVNENY